MRALRPAEVLHLQAAIGWVELGNPQAACQELHRIPAEAREHPDVLEVHCRVFGLAKHWQGVIGLAKILQSQQPDSARGWLLHAEALHHAGRSEAAKVVLIEARQRVKGEPLIAYNLARYCCASGDVSGATRWLDEALKSGDKRALRWRVLDDPLLKRLRERHHKVGLVAQETQPGKKKSSLPIVLGTFLSTVSICPELLTAPKLPMNQRIEGQYTEMSA